jgi:hypothetical protein
MWSSAEPRGIGGRASAVSKISLRLGENEDKSVAPRFGCFGLGRVPLTTSSDLALLCSPPGAAEKEFGQPGGEKDADPGGAEPRGEEEFLFV